MKIEITTDADRHDCESCCVTLATGGAVYIDGVEIIDKPAVVHCFDGIDFSESDLLVMALARVGITVEVDGMKWHVSRHDDDHYGKMGLVH